MTTTTDQTSAALGSSEGETANASSPASAAAEPPRAGAESAPTATENRAHIQDEEVPGWMVALATVVVPGILFMLLPPLSRAGLWDPPELNVADLARRIAVNVYGAAQLALTGTDNSMPHLNDLGKPELPFTSIALGFKMFGLHEWSGRLPLAVWGLAGVGALYASVARLVDRKAGIYAALVLATTPLFAVQARTMIGDVVVMSALAMSIGGFSVALVDPIGGGRRAGHPTVRWAFVAMGLVGLLVGYYSRGLFLGVTTPLVATGLMYLLLLAASWSGPDDKLSLDIASHVVGGLALAAAVATAPAVYAALTQPDRLNMNAVLGGMIKPPPKFPTHDFMLGQVAHAMAPWSAFAPFALGRLFLAPRDEGVRGTAARAAVLVGFAAVFVAQGLLVAKVDAVAFGGPALLAAACGIALRDYERKTHPSIAIGVGTFLVLFLLRHDFKHLPEKAFQVFGVTSATFPESFKETSKTLWMVLLMAFAVITFLTWVERDAKRAPFDANVYLRVFRALRDAWDGLLSLVYFALVAGASLAGLLVFIGARTKAKWLPTFPKQVSEYLLNAWWMALVAPFAVVFGLLFLCDVWAWAFDRAKRPGWSSFTRGFEPFEELFSRIKTEKDRSLRGTYALLILPFMVLAVPGAVAAGLLLEGSKPAVALALALPSGIGAFLAIGALGELVRGSRSAGALVLGGAIAAAVSGYYYPALANQLSPKEVFESYSRVHKGDEPLGLFGVGSRTAAYYAGGQPPSFNDAMGAYDWLAGGPAAIPDADAPRKFLAMRADELGRLNRVYRERTRQNIPVLDARSSQILLVASRLAPGEKNQSPLEKVILSAPPKPQRPLTVNMDDKLEVLGIDVADANGRLVDFVTPGRKFQIRTYFKVLAPVTAEWEAFIHIDGYQRRHNGDHKIVQGKYPFANWLKDDYIVDVHEFQLEPNFSPGGYTIFFGLFMGESRFKVKSGPSDGDNRINAGALRVQ